jgi:hypothetical protein
MRPLVSRTLTTNVLPFTDSAAAVQARVLGNRVRSQAAAERATTAMRTSRMGRREEDMGMKPRAGVVSYA